MKLIKIFLLCPIFLVLLSSCSQQNPDNSATDPSGMESGPGSDEEITDSNVPESPQDNTQVNSQQLNEIDCGERTDPNYLICRFEVSRNVTELANPKRDHERHICRKEGQPDVVLLLTEFSYPTSDHPDSSLVCTIFAGNDLKGFANSTPGFCRDNNLANGRIDSLAELLADYQSPNKGYVCTQDISGQ